MTWLTAYPDTLLDEVPDDAGDPDRACVARETIELAFLTALQVLPARQRAVLLAREVLGLPAADTARLLDTSVAAANSALQRARDTMRRQLPSHRSDWSAREPSADERRLVAAFVDAHERCDPAAAIAAAATDIRVTMPPHAQVYDGLDAVSALIERGLGPERVGDWRLLPVALNRMPATVSYLRRPGDSLFRSFKVDVLRIEGDRIAEIITLGPAALIGPLGLPATLADDRERLSDV